MSTQYRVPVLEKYEFQPAVLDKDLSTPPVSPVAGDRYIVATGGTGAWATHDKHIAWFNGTTWDFYIPVEGWLTWIKDEDLFYYYSGASVWTALPVGDMQKSVYDTDNDGRVDKAESVDDGVSITTAAQVKEAYDRRASFNTSLNVIEFNLNP